MVPFYISLKTSENVFSGCRKGFTFLSSLLRFSKVIYLRCFESPYKISKKMTVMNICDFPEIFIDFQSNLAAYLGTYQAFMMEFLGEDC